MNEQYRKDLGPRNEEIIKRVYMDGEPIAQVAAAYRMSYENVRKIMRANGMPPLHEWRKDRPRRSRSFRVKGEDPLYKIILDRQGGMSWADIAEKYRAVSTLAAIKAVEYQCKRRGLPWPIERTYNL